MERVETMIVGAGQAGLAMSYHLRHLGQEHVILERARVADRWRSQRWDSLMFQFPNWSIELPGQPYQGADPDGFSDRATVMRLVEDYARQIDAPVRPGNARSLRRAERDGRFVVETDDATYEARHVVLATGPYQRARIPAFAANLPASIEQVHAGDYRNPSQLAPGAVLVVGSGASGCQIADELIDAGRRVYLAVGRHRRAPRRYRGRDLFWWRREIGELDGLADSGVKMEVPLMTGVRGGYDVDIRSYARRGATILGHIRDASDGCLAVAPDLEALLADGDRKFREFTRAVDEHVARTGLEVGPPDAIEPSASPVEELERLALRSAGIACVLWATGYDLDFGWVDVPMFGSANAPVHRRGVSAARGVYLLGLLRLHKFKSSFLYGVGEDAEYIAEHIHAAG